MFDNIQKAKTKVANQQINKSGEVVKKQKGRPSKPDMRTVQIRLHTSLIKRVADYSKELGVAKSQLIAMSLESYMSQAKKVFKIVEINK